MEGWEGRGKETPWTKLHWFNSNLTWRFIQPSKGLGRAERLNNLTVLSTEDFVGLREGGCCLRPLRITRRFTRSNLGWVGQTETLSLFEKGLLTYVWGLGVGPFESTLTCPTRENENEACWLGVLHRLFGIFVYWSWNWVDWCPIIFVHQRLTKYDIIDSTSIRTPLGTCTVHGGQPLT